MVSNLPLGKLNRDEIYTFIGGLFVSQVWFLYLLSSGKIELNESLYIPLGIMLWIGSTASLFLFGTILYVLTNKLHRDITNKDYEKIENKVQYATNANETLMHIHIYAVIFSSFVLVSIPTIDFICRSEFSNLWMLAFLTPLILSLVFFSNTFKRVKVFDKCVKDGKCKYI